LAGSRQDFFAHHRAHALAPGADGALGHCVVNDHVNLRTPNIVAFS
jgi:hypothetical protein